MKLTLILLVTPLLFALFALFVKGKQAAIVALTGSLLTLVVSAVMYVEFIRDATVQFEFDLPWVETFGIHFHAGVDGISLILVLLTTVLTPFIILSTFKREYKNASAFYSLILLMQAGLLGVFTAMDAFLFYVCYELALIPIYFICGIWGGENRVRVTLKFFIYTLAGSLFMLIAIIFLYFKTPGNHTFDIATFYKVGLTPSEQSWIFWAFFLAFAIKIPIFPFHTWQPDTYTEAPAAGTMLLAGIMLKMGVYGLIRLVLPIVPAGVEQWGTLAMVLCIIGIVYASIIAIRQNDLKTFVAYSSIAHVDLIAAGVLSGNAQGIQGAMLQMFNHGINAVALFFLIDVMERKAGTRFISDFGGIASKSIRFAVVFMIVLLGSVGLPLTNGFVGEFLLLFGVYGWNSWAALFAGTTIILGAVYMLRMYRDVFFGETSQASLLVTNPDRGVEGFVIYPLCLIILVLGIQPNLLLNISEPAVQQVMNVIVNSKTLLGGL